MAKYRVIAASVNIHAGVLGLEPHQARARLHRLKPCGGNRDARDGVPLGGTGMNRYEVIDPPVAFKRGEEFEYEGELPKHLVECVTSCMAFPAIDADLASEDGPDDGVAAEHDPYREIGMDLPKPPPKRRNAARGAKPAA